MKIFGFGFTFFCHIYIYVNKYIQISLIYPDSEQIFIFVYWTEYLFQIYLYSITYFKNILVKNNFIAENIFIYYWYNGLL